MNTHIQHLYRKQREAGWSAQYALSHAKTVDAFEDAENAGLVKLEWETDRTARFADLAGDLFNPKANPRIPPGKLVRDAKEFQQRMVCEGVWGLVGYYRIDRDSDWQEADDFWGFVGHDAAGYEYDIMASTLSKLNAARRT